MGARMTDEPTPQPIEDGTPGLSEPIAAEQATAFVEEQSAAVPDPLRQRNPFGWLVSGLLILLFVVGAVAGYVNQPIGETPQTALQSSLRFSVSLDSSFLPAMRKTIEKSRDDGLREVLKESTEKAPESDEAARIAVVAARELKAEPPNAAVDRLAKSDDELSRVMARVYGDEGPSAAELWRLRATESETQSVNEEFAVILAKVQASEMAGEPSDRELVVDKSLFAKLAVVTLGGLGTLVAGAVCLIAFLALNSSGKIVPVGFGRFEKSDGDRYAGRFAMYLFAFLGIGYLGGRLSELPAFDGVSDVWFSLCVLIASLFVVVLLLRVPLMERTDSFASVVGERRPFWKLVRTGAFGYLCTVPLLLVAIMLLAGLSRYLPAPTHPVSEDIAVATSLDWLAIALMAACLAPLIEELAFRGLLFPALATQIRKPWVAMIACGLVFASIHPQGPLAWPALATTGAAAAALRYYTGSLVPSIVLHMIHNALILVIASLIG
jgi:membrane protease YdiL (CAAX protease family)